MEKDSLVSELHKVSSSQRLIIKMVGLTKEQKQFYKDNGFIVLKNILSKSMVKELSDEYDNIFKRCNVDKMEQSWIGKRDDDERINNTPYTVKGVHNLQNHHAVFGQFMCHPDLLDCLEDIMETKNIMLHHTKAHFKPPGKGAEYPMHQDYPYFPYENDSPVAVFLNLDASGPENGGLYIYPGSHKLGPQKETYRTEGGYFHVNKEKFPMSKATPVICDQGDIVVFSYLTIHGSSHNMSTRPRRMFLVEYISADDKPILTAETNGRYQPGYGWLFRGVNVHKDYNTANRFSPV